MLGDLLVQGLHVSHVLRDGSLFKDFAVQAFFGELTVAEPAFLPAGGFGKTDGAGGALLGRTVLDLPAFGLLNGQSRDLLGLQLPAGVHAPQDSDHTGGDDYGQSQPQEETGKDRQEGVENFHRIYLN